MDPIINWEDSSYGIYKNKTALRLKASEVGISATVWLGKLGKNKPSWRWVVHGTVGDLTLMGYSSNLTYACEDAERFIRAARELRPIR